MHIAHIFDIVSMYLEWSKLEEKLLLVTKKNKLLCKVMGGPSVLPPLTTWQAAVKCAALHLPLPSRESDSQVRLLLPPSLSEPDKQFPSSPQDVAADTQLRERPPSPPPRSSSGPHWRPTEGLLALNRCLLMANRGCLFGLPPGQLQLQRRKIATVCA